MGRILPLRQAYARESAHTPEVRGSASEPQPAQQPFLGASPATVEDGEEGDAELLRRVSQGDLGPLGVLYDRHHERVHQFVSRATAGGADADDITHEAFLALASVAHRFDGRPSARPLLIGIAAQLVRQHRRAGARLLQVLASFANGLSGRSVRTPEDAASVTEELGRFEQALARLPEEKRLVLLLVEREGLTGEEVAAALHVPLNTVWTRLHYARAEVRRTLDPQPRGTPRH
jgi:RNA polymerase sigma-70 factor (ECF subfamily)